MFQFLKMLRLKRHQKPLLSQRAHPQSPFYPDQLEVVYLQSFYWGGKKTKTFKQLQTEYVNTTLRGGLCAHPHSLINIAGLVVVVVVVLHRPALNQRTSGQALNHAASCQGS